MSEIKTLLNQSSHYFAGQIILMAAGFISFPIMTRVFSVGDYGLLGLVTTTLLIVNAVAKFGLPGSIVQFYAEFKANNRLEAFRSTMFISAMGSAATIAILFYVLGHLFGGKIFDKNIVTLIPIVSILILTGCTSDILATFLRAAQRTKFYNLVAIIRRYGSLLAGIFFLLFVVKGLYGFYFGQTLWGVVVLLFLIYVSARGNRISASYFSIEILGASIRFGFPLIWAELGHLFLNYVDRYLVQLYVGSVSLGIYIAGYNLATYVTEMVMYPINYAMTPIYMSVLVNKGEEKTREFLSKTFRYFVMIMLAIVVGFIAVGKDLINLLATEKYSDAYSVLPYIVVGQFAYACSIVLNNGLFIRRKTYIVSYVIAFACLTNIGLNLALIPKSGIIGAAQATLISNIFYTFAITYYAFKEFSFKIDYGHITLYLCASIVMYVAIKKVHFVGNHLSNLIAEVLVGGVVYSVMVLMFDRDVRGTVVKIAKRLRKEGVKK